MAKNPLLTAYDKMLASKAGIAPAAGALDSIRSKIPAMGAAVAVPIAQIGERIQADQPAKAPAAPVKIGYSEAEKSFFINGQKVPFSGDTLRSIHGTKDSDFPDMPPGSMPATYRAFKPEYARNYFTFMRDNDMESATGQLSLASFKSAVGGAMTAPLRMAGMDVKNPWSDARENAVAKMGIGEQIGAGEKAFDSFTGFLNAATEGVAGVAPALLGAAAATAVTGGAAAPAYIVGGAIGAATAASSQSEAAQDRLTKVLIADGMDPIDAKAEAFRASRGAGAVAGASTLPMTAIAGPLVGNIARKIPGVKGLLGLSDKAAGTSLFKSALVRTPARMIGVGGLEGGQEVFEAEASQQAADVATGQVNPLGTYADMRDFQAGAATGMVFSLFGGGGAYNAPNADNDPMAAALAATQIAGAEEGASADGAPPADAPSGVRGSVRVDPAVAEGAEPLGRAVEKVMYLDAQLVAQYGEDISSNMEELSRDPEFVDAMQALSVAREQVQSIYQRQKEMSPTPPPPGPLPPEPAPPSPMELVGSLHEAMAADDVETVQQMAQQGVITDEVAQLLVTEYGYDADEVMTMLQEMGAESGVPVASQDTGERGPVNLHERRVFQGMQQDEAQAASEANPLALPPSDVLDIESEIQQLTAEIQRRGSQNPQFPRTAIGRSMLNALQDLESQWQEAKESAGPQGVMPYADPNAPDPASEPLGSAGIGTPPPVDAPADGLGVSPDPLPNPEPMSPGEAQGRIDAQAARGGGPTVGLPTPGAAPPAMPVGAQTQPEPPAAPAPGVSKTTPEPSKDIAAQVRAMVSGKTGRDLVFIADGDPSVDAYRNRETLPDHVQQIFVPKVGLFLTTHPGKAYTIQQRAKRRQPFDDNVIGTLLGYSESKGEVLVNEAQTGKPAVVVQAKDKAGAVVAEQVATPSKVEKAKAATKRLGGAGSAVEVTTPEATLARRAAEPAGSLGAEAVGKAKAKNPSADSRKDLEESDNAEVMAKATGDLEFALLTKDPEEIAAAKVEAQALLSDGQFHKAWIAARQRVLAAEDDAKASQKRKGKLPKPAAKPAPTKAPLPPKAAAAIGRGREVTSKPAAKGKAKKAAKDDEDRAAFIKQRAEVTPTALTAVRGAPVTVPSSLITTTAMGDGPLRVENSALNAELRSELQSALDAGRLTPESAATAAKLVLTMDQLQALITANADAARAELDASIREEGGDPVAGADLAIEPLTRGEVSALTDMIVAQAKHEQSQVAAGTWSHKASNFRRLFGQLVPALALDLNNAATAKVVLKRIAAYTEEQTQALYRSASPTVRSSQMAKAAVRGALAVNEDTSRAERGATPAGSHKMSHITVVDGVPQKYADTLNGWMALFEGSTQSALNNVVLMTLADAKARFPSIAAVKNIRGAAKYVVWYGKVRMTVIAVDTTLDAPLALEIMAHETGHVLSVAALQSASRETQRAVMRAFEAWRAAAKGRTSSQVLRSRFTGVRASELEIAFGNLPDDYALDFREWAADNVAAWMLTSKQPQSVVDKFFADIAKILRKVYASIMGKGMPDVAWRDAMDLFLARSKEGLITDVAGPYDGLTADEQAFFLKNDPQSKGGVLLDKKMAERATETLGDLKAMFAPMLDPVAGKDARSAAWTWLKQGGVGDALRSAQLWTMQGSQLADMYKDHPMGKSLRAVVRLRDTVGALARKLQEASNLAHEQASAMSSDTRTQLALVMKHSTLWRIHPERAFDDVSHKHLTSKDDRVTLANKRMHIQMQAEWAHLLDLDKRAEEAYYALRDAPVELRKKSLDTQKENLERLRAGRSKAGQAMIDEKIAELDREMLAVQNGPFFPLYREGKYIVTAELPWESFGQHDEKVGEGAEYFPTKSAAETEKTYMLTRMPGASIDVESDPDEGGWYLRIRPRAMYRFPTMRAANAAKGRIEADIRQLYEYAGFDFDADMTVRGEKNPIINPPKTADNRFEEGKRNTDSRFWVEMEAILKENDASPTIRLAYEQLYLESLPEFSYRKSALRRERVLGADDNMLKAHSHRMRGAAYALAEITHSHAANKAMNDLKASSDLGRKTANALQDGEKLARERTASTPGNKLANALVGFSATYALGLAPAYVLTNAAQPLIVSVPVLAGISVGEGMLGIPKAAGYIGDAYKQVGTYFLGRGWKDFKNELTRMRGAATEGKVIDASQELLDRVSGGNAHLRQVLEVLLDRGRLDFSFLDSMDDALKGGYSMWGSVVRLGMAFPQQTEAMNRVVTAIAAFRVATQDLKLNEDGKDLDSTVTNFVDSLVHRTQLDYTTNNRPPIFNFPGLSVFLQFKLFMQGMYVLFVDNINKGLRGATPAERRQGWATVRYLMLTHGAVGGLAGLGPIAVLAKLGMVAVTVVAGEDDDEWKTPNTLIRQALSSYVGEELSEAGMRGLPVLIGVDVADRMGLPNLYDSKYAGTGPRDTDAQGFDKLTLFAMGAPYANARRIYAGLRDPIDPDLTPSDSAWAALPAGARAAARALRQGSQGALERDGDVFVKASDLSWGDTAIGVLGFQSGTMSSAYNKRTETQTYKGKIEVRRTELIKRSIVDGDKSQNAAFNRSVPAKFRITQDTLDRAVESRRDRESGKLNAKDRAVRDTLE